MSTDTTQNGIRAWFDAVLDIPPADRRAWLGKYCLDPTLRTQILGLLTAHETTDEPISKPVGEWFLALDDDLEFLEEEPDQLVGKQIAGFRLLRHLGSGGMSSVYLGERNEADFHHAVAIKVLKNNVYSASEQRLFRRERQLLAELEHPNIARFIDGGLTDSGLPYLIMEYVDGLAITTYCQKHDLGHEERVKLFLAVCRATDYAHRSSIVHRDIKPANILVSKEGAVKLLDFGIAKLLNPDDSGTLTAKIYLTPEYAAPEQFKKGGDSTSIDVYSLGVLLHELLIGVRPNRAVPIKASSVVSQQANTDKVVSLKTRALQRYLRGDLDNIIAHAMHEDPAMRYRNAGEFADDLDRFLNGQPVEAHPPSAWYRTRKFIQRHRGAVGLTIVLTVAVLANLALAAVQGFEAQRQAKKAQIESVRAQAEATRANQVLDFVLELFGASREVMPEAERLSPVQLVAIAERKLQDSQSLDPISRAQMWIALGEISHSLSQFPSATKQFEQAEKTLQIDTSENAIAVRQKARVLLATTNQETGDYDAAQKLLTEDFDLKTVNDKSVQYHGYSILVGTKIAQRAKDTLALAKIASDVGMSAFPAKSEKWLIARLLPAQTMPFLEQHKEALPLLQQGVQDWQAWSLPNSPDYVALLNSLSIVQFTLGEMDGGLAAMDKAIEAARAIHHGPSAMLVTLLQSRASMASTRGDGEAALAGIQASFEAASSIFPENSARLLTLRANSAPMYSMYASPELASNAYNEVLKMCKARAQDTLEGDCGRTHINFSSYLSKQNQLAEASRQIQLGLKMQIANFGESSVQVAHAFTIFGNLKIKQDAPLEALSLYDRALQIYRDKKFADRRFGNLQLDRAKVLVLTRQWPEARSAIEAAIENLNQNAEPDRIRRANAYGYLAIISEAQNEAAQAKIAVQQAQKMDPKFQQNFSNSLLVTLEKLMQQR